MAGGEKSKEEKKRGNPIPCCKKEKANDSKPEHLQPLRVPRSRMPVEVVVIIWAGWLSTRSPGDAQIIPLASPFTPSLHMKFIRGRREASVWAEIGIQNVSRARD
ncbi:uncharacterized protein MCYG_08435 [Microsporum canis CBS 113480]|uniref:Uncharacterized protein n=1 Tax=Arthroderma otae (strain ATCC MYA-4605 / CBS 113480) TaxID=554155 RepID=C5G0G3_ARTOC|nr:uncharacterized protein MCYG_08435 [Microsporum canis CBS 113480]EEQ35616.1 predicted protein [Microsporum canis CBS 113480]